MGSPRLLFVSRYIPTWGSRDGSSAYCLELLRYLSLAGYDLHILSLQDQVHVSNSKKIGPISFPPRYELPAKLTVSRHIINRNIIIDLRPEAWLHPLLLRLAAKVQRLWRRTPNAKSQRTDAFERLVDTDEISIVRRATTRIKPDIIMANYAFLAPVFEDADPDNNIIRSVLTHDVRWQRFRDLDNAPDYEGVSWTPEMEGRLLEKADVVIAINHYDATQFARIAPSSRIVEAPMSLPGTDIGPPGDGARIAFIGGLAKHNVQGIRWFLSDIWPLVREKRPDATLMICGAVGKCISAPPDGVQILGEVDDLDSVLRDCQISIAPLLAGSGLKIKVVYSLSRARPVIATPVAAVGLESFQNSGLIVAEDATAFAQAVIETLSNPQLLNELSQKAAMQAETLFPSQACYGTLDACFREMLSTRTR